MRYREKSDFGSVATGMLDDAVNGRSRRVPREEGAGDDDAEDIPSAHM